MNAENKVRVVMVEASGSDAVMSQALAGFLRALDRAEEPTQNTLPPPIIEEPRALPAPAKRVKSEPVARRKAGVRQARLPLKQDGAAPDAGTRAQIIAALEKKAMNSGDVVKATGLSKSSVYSMLHILRKEGVVESREIEDSIYPVQYLVNK